MLGLKRPIYTEDIYKNLREHEAAALTDKFNKLWEEEKRKKQPRLFSVFRRIYAKKIIFHSIIYTIIDIILRYVMPRSTQPVIV